MATARRRRQAPVQVKPRTKTKFSKENPGAEIIMTATFDKKNGEEGWLVKSQVDLGGPRDMYIQVAQQLLMVVEGIGKVLNNEGGRHA